MGTRLICRRRNLLVALAVFAALAAIPAASLLDGLRAAEADAATEAADSPAGQKADPPETIDPMSVNATCYVCHMTFVHEEISKIHFHEKVTCIDCHGLSAAHANDEDIGATKPDKIYSRREVDPMCSECHEKHNVPARQVLARWLELPPTEFPPVCTDCHGTHKIEQAAEETEEEKEEEEKIVN